MSILEQVLALGEQLTPEERQTIATTWLDDNPDPEHDFVLSDETKRHLDDIQAKLQSGDMKAYPLEEAMHRVRHRIK